MHSWRQAIGELQGNGRQLHAAMQWTSSSTAVTCSGSLHKSVAGLQAFAQGSGGAVSNERGLECLIIIAAQHTREHQGT